MAAKKTKEKAVKKKDKRPLAPEIQARVDAVKAEAAAGRKLRVEAQVARRVAENYLLVELNEAAGMLAVRNALCVNNGKVLKRTSKMTILKGEEYEKVKPEVDALVKKLRSIVG